MNEKKKRQRKPRKQATKKGHVIRVSPRAWSAIEKKRKSRETIITAVERLLGVSESESRDGSATYFILPDAGIVLRCKSRAEARGAAVVLAVGRRTKPETPIEVRAVG